MRLVFYTVFSLLALGLIVGYFSNTAHADTIFQSTINEVDKFGSDSFNSSSLNNVITDFAPITIDSSYAISFDFYIGLTATSSNANSGTFSITIGRFSSPFNNAQWSISLDSEQLAELNANKGTTIRIRRENMTPTGTFNLGSPYFCQYPDTDCGIQIQPNVSASASIQLFMPASNTGIPFGSILTGDDSFPPDDTSTRIVNMLPVLPGETSTTTPTTSVTFAVGGYVNSLTPLELPDRLLLRANRIDQSGGFFEEWEIEYDTLFATSTTLMLATSSQWRYYWQFLTPSDTVYLQSDTYTVNVISNPLPGLVGVGDLGDLTGLATSTCSIGNIAGCFQNALIFAFYPNEDFLRGMFDSLRGLVAQKPPFGYINNTIAEMEDIEEGEAPFSIAFLYAFSGVFTPLRNGLSAVLWFLALVYFYNRMKHIEP